MAVNPVPQTPSNAISLSQAVGNAVKVSTPDIIIKEQDSIPLGLQYELIFEEIAGEEIISILRHDTVNGQDIAYSPIKNVKSIYLQNSPSNILSLQGSADKTFNAFPIKMENYVSLNEPTAYYDKATMSLIIEISDVQSDRQIEVQIMSSGVILDDTIY